MKSPIPLHEIHGDAHGRLAVIFAPLLALCSLTAIFAAAAGFLGWYQGEMLSIAAGVCALMLAICMALLLRSIEIGRAHV